MENKYTKADVNRIAETFDEGLSRGPWRRPMMSDAEFERRYDPAAYEHRKLMAVLNRVAAALENAPVQAPPRPGPDPRPRPPDPAPPNQAAGEGGGRSRRVR